MGNWSIQDPELGPLGLLSCPSRPASASTNRFPRPPSSRGHLCLPHFDDFLLVAEGFWVYADAFEHVNELVWWVLVLSSACWWQHVQTKTVTETHTTSTEAPGARPATTGDTSESGDQNASRRLDLSLCRSTCLGPLAGAEPICNPAFKAKLGLFQGLRNISPLFRDALGPSSKPIHGSFFPPTWMKCLSSRKPPLLQCPT